MLFKKKKPKGPKFSSASSMAPPSLSTLLPHARHSFLPPTNPNITHRYMLSLRPSHSLSFAARFSSDKQNDSTTDNRITYPPAQPPAPPPPEKKSFAVATGELFLGIASRVLKRANKINYNGNVDHEERIGAVMKDEVEPEVIWEQRVKDIEAEKERPVVTSPGFSFSAAGLLFPYHLGVAHLLIEKGYIKETTPLAGSSAGAIVCAVIASGASMHEALTATKVLAEDCRLKGTAFRLGAVLRDVLEKFLPDDVHIRSNGRVRVLSIPRLAWVEVRFDPRAGHMPYFWVYYPSMEMTIKSDPSFTACRCRRAWGELSRSDSGVVLVLNVWCFDGRCGGAMMVAVTQILWRPRGLLVDQFDSKEDLINAVVTSSFIPGYLAPRPATMFRNRLCIDGGLTLFMPPTSAAQTVRICAFPVSQMGLQGIGISPDCNPENRATPRELFKWALEPAEDHVLDRLFELGYLDAAVWAEENPVQNVVQDDCPLVENGSSTSP
ncbi:hypothetical protein POTOM_005180 [Populus tomentosa]|uniref:PNPLA domain-containing protein n=1 Tax=Populus tomentosa TaxID=118781 RepID=A0A8X8DFR0_POPTO|nr:hypothetical protein POTOM_005180 [Populus tomentosa]